MATGRRHGGLAQVGEASRQRSWRRYLTTRPNWATEILFVFPLLLVYQVGAFSATRLNGVDLVTTLLFRLQAVSPPTFLALVVGVLVAVIVLYLRQRRRERFQFRLVWRLLLESGLYAFFMGSLILLIMIKILGLHPPSVALGEPLSPWMIVYVSAGAGVPEELVFRVLIYGGLLWLFSTPRIPRSVAVIGALLISSALFSAAHHLPPHGDPWVTFTFVYRLFAGLIFGVIYHFRGLAAAVYTHFLYDVLVLSLNA
jgi:membrane protease YdiL (CAAX protease family)